jgi:hypothetical protein
MDRRTNRQEATAYVSTIGLSMRIAESPQRGERRAGIADGSSGLDGQKVAFNEQ